MSFFGSRRHVEEPVPPTPEPVAPPTTPIPVQQPIGFETVIGGNATFEGNFTSSSNVRIDGTFTGSININGNVLVGETAKINADLYAKNISIAGAVRGNVHGKKVQLLRTGRVWGDINATALTTEEGAFIDGKISMVSPDAPKKVDPNILVDEPGFLDEPEFDQSNEDGVSVDELEEFDEMDELEDLDELETFEDSIGDLDGGLMLDDSEFTQDDTLVDEEVDDNNWNGDNRY
jgi:cytoskeletal protein CcmA (bactofilin family)